ncbi:MAG: ABC transporter permease [Bacteroidales bacterium]|jgi:putative ABC transport system permease protein|nr:ABC transporter permease [Bacteroidales bacterium]MDD3697135.1 ABC transporter permease [Bacteroidales bacterium]MDD4473317.1 ABC transporter permease [Bacteroidales bacterium]
MIKQYFKQAWQLLKQNKLFSAIYIIGTALGISMVMVMAIINYVKTADISPEINRSRMLYAKSGAMAPVDTVRFKYTNSGSLSYKAAKELFIPLKTPERVSVMMENDDFASLPTSENLLKVKNKGVDTDYWKIFQFKFVKGKPFSDADFASGLKVAVICESLARKLFNSTDVVGQTIEYGFKPYRIVGVVKDVTYVLSDTYAQLWMPYTSIDGYDYIWDDRGGMLGDISKIFILARHASDFDAVRNEINNRVKTFNAQAKDWKLDLLGQPDTRKVDVNRFWSNVGPDMKKIKPQNILVVLLLLLIPAINLSGMNSTRMESRLGEMGVRKSFGASRSKLVNQVLIENLLLTGLGGLAGLILSYLIIFFTRTWIMDLGKSFAEVIQEGTSVNFSMSMLFNVRIFLLVLLACLAMNILSALVPVYRSLRKSITDSLHIKYN